jgi:hypothetical protein
MKKVKEKPVSERQLKRLRSLSPLPETLAALNDTPELLAMARTLTRPLVGQVYPPANKYAGRRPWHRHRPPKLPGQSR